MGSRLACLWINVLPHNLSVNLSGITGLRGNKVNVTECRLD
jgi:hypothetical protein